MAFYSFLPEELTAMDGLSAEHKTLFFEVIVPNRIRSTGMCSGRGVTLPDMQISLYVAPGRGITNGGKPSKSRVRRLLSGLERVGVIQRVGQAEFLCFVCPIFNQFKSVHFSARNIPDTIPTPLPDMGILDNSLDVSDTYSDGDAIPDTKKRAFSAKPDTYTEVTEVIDDDACAREDVDLQGSGLVGQYMDFLSGVSDGVGSGLPRFRVDQLSSVKALTMYQRWAGMGIRIETVVKAVNGCSDRGYFPAWPQGYEQDVINQHNGILRDGNGGKNFRRAGRTSAQAIEDQFERLQAFVH